MERILQENTPTVGPQYSDKWIVWNAEQTEIIASADTYEAATEKAGQSGDPDPIIEKVPPLDGGIVGGL